MKKKYFAKSGPYHYNTRAGAIHPKLRDLIKHKDQGIEADLDRLLLSKEAPGVIFGFLEDDKEKSLIGMPQHEEGNILVVGGNGSGKAGGLQCLP